MKQNDKKAELGMLLAILGASALGNMVAGKPKKPGRGVIRAGEGVIQVGEGQNF